MVQVPLDLSRLRSQEEQPALRQGIRPAVQSYGLGFGGLGFRGVGFRGIEEFYGGK